MRSLRGICGGLYGLRREGNVFLVWGCKVSLMGFQGEIFLKVNSLNRERYEEMISLKEGSSFQPLMQGRSLTAYIHQNGEQMGSNPGASDQSIAGNG